MDEKDIRVETKNGKTTYYIGDVEVQRIADNNHGSRVYFHPDGTSYHFPLVEDPSVAKCWLVEKGDGTMFYCSKGEVSYVSDRYLNESEISGNFVYDDHCNRVYELPNGKKYYFNIESYPDLYSGRCWATRDKDGKYTYYDTQKARAVYTKDEDGNEVHFKGDGWTVDYTKDKNGNKVKYQGDVVEVHFYKGSSAVAYTKDKKGNEIYYKKDGKTIDYTKNKEGDVEHYTDGIRNNMLAENRKKFATRFGLRDVSMPRWVKEAEEKISRKVEEVIQKKKSGNGKDVAQKTTKTNGGQAKER